MTLTELEKALSATAKPVVILLVSEDAYLVQATLQLARQAYLGTSDTAQIQSQCLEEAFRVGELGGKTALSRLQGGMATLPMFASQKLLILREAELLEGEAEEELQAMLTDWSVNKSTAPTNTPLLIQCAKLRSNAKLRKLVSAVGVVVELDLSRKPQLAVAVRELAKKKGLNLKEEVIQFLLDYVPPDLSRMANELEKLSLYAAKNGTITLPIASELVCSSNLETIFRMTDAIGERTPKVALQIVASMLESGEAPQMILTMIARHMRHLYRAKLVERLRVSRDVLATALETQSSFVIEKALRQARGFSVVSLRRSMRRLQEVDLELKRSAASPQLAIERLVYEFCRS